jgi:hypothetical protein
MIDVYFSAYLDDKDALAKSIQVEYPEKLTKAIANEYGFLSHGYLSCPAASNLFKNTFVVRAQKDFVIDFSEDTEDYYLSKTNGIIFGGTMKLNYIFFSKSDIEIEVFPAYMHKNEFTVRTILPAGKFNISKWFRGIHAEYFVADKHPVNVRKGDALFYVNFPSSETVNLKYFDMKQEHFDVAAFCLALKNHLPNKKLHEIYEIFQSKQYDLTSDIQ